MGSSAAAFEPRCVVSVYRSLLGMKSWVVNDGPGGPALRKREREDEFLRDVLHGEGVHAPEANPPVKCRLADQHTASGTALPDFLEPGPDEGGADSPPLQLRLDRDRPERLPVLSAVRNLHRR